MSAHYDKFDYPSYWNGREYEHKSELIAISSFIKRVNNIHTILEIGAGYGRLVPTYIHRCKSVILSDPSSKLLSLASQKFKSKKITYVHSTIENIQKKIGRKSIDLIVMVRVLHHIKNINNAFSTISKILNKKGYLILEFPNKIHSKALIRELLKGNFTAIFDIFPKDIRSKNNIRKKSIGFNNYHPGYIKEVLRENGFEIIETRSVSNIRSNFLKRNLPFHILYKLEQKFQIILSYIYFGPSTFILAVKN